MTTFSDEERAAIARRWGDSGLAQDEYAEQFGIAGRTLRLWLARFASRQPPLAGARAVLADTVERLQALLAAVDAELAQVERDAASPTCRQACQVADAQEDAPPECSGVSERNDANRCAATACQVGAADATRHADSDLAARTQAKLARLEVAPMSPPWSAAATTTPGRANPRPKTGGFFATWGDEN